MEYSGQPTEGWKRPVSRTPRMKEAADNSLDRSHAAAGPDERERMMLEEIPAVRWIARRIHERLPQHVELEDLVSAGTLGLIDAVRKFDPAKKVQFRSYA